MSLRLLIAIIFTSVTVIKEFFFFPAIAVPIPILSNTMARGIGVGACPKRYSRFLDVKIKVRPKPVHTKPLVESK